jgi:hypothetical protein
MSQAIGAKSPKEDRKENQLSLEGFRLMSSYRTTAGDSMAHVSVVATPAHKYSEAAE